MRGEKDWIQTVGGRRFYPFDAYPDEVFVEDIAHALANLCRYCGHTSDFYSVAQHSVIVSQVVEPQFALWGLLHDATEAYLGDVTRPVKQHLREYRDVEARLMEVIADRFGLPMPEPAEVKIADIAVLQAERRDLLSHAMEWSKAWAAKAAPVTIDPLPPRAARSLFLDRFYELTDLSRGDCVGSIRYQG